MNTGGALSGPIVLVLQGLSAKAKLLGCRHDHDFFPGSPVRRGHRRYARCITSRSPSP